MPLRVKEIDPLHGNRRYLFAWETRHGNLKTPIFLSADQGVLWMQAPQHAPGQYTLPSARAYIPFPAEQLPSLLIPGSRHEYQHQATGYSWYVTHEDKSKTGPKTLIHCKKHTVPAPLFSLPVLDKLQPDFQTIVDALMAGRRVTTGLIETGKLTTLIAPPTATQNLASLLTPRGHSRQLVR